jgi:hypothetical protein
MNGRILLAGFLVCVSHAALAQTELIVNGGFESLTTPWAVGAVGGSPTPSILSVSGVANSGSGYLKMGGWNNVTDQWIYQEFTFPTNTVDEVFSFYYNFYSTDSGFSTLTFQAQLYETNGTFLTDIVPTTSFANSAAGLGNGFYTHAVIPLATYAGTTNLAPFAGQTVRLYFLAQTDAFGSVTALNIDDVSLLVGTTADVPSNDNFSNRIVLATNSTSVTATATNIYATKETGEPNHAGVTCSNSVWWSWTAPAIGTATIDTLGSSFTTLLGVYTGSSVSNLTKVVSNNGAGSGRGAGAARVTFPTATGTEYQIAVDSYGGASGTIDLSLSFKIDKTAPTVTFKSPAAGAKVTNSTVTVTGTASDNTRVALVQYRLENATGTNAYQDATGTNNWSAIVTNLLPGLNRVRVLAIDTSSNVSAGVARSFTYVIVSPLTLNTNGFGRISPNLNGKLLDVGSTYTVTATPGAGYLFAGWTNDVVSDKARLTFLMHSNMLLTANFVPNPFIPIAGIYQGLFTSTNVAYPSSGWFSGKLRSSGAFTGNLRLAGGSYSWSGQFGLDGAWSNTLALRGLTPLSVQLQLDLAGTTLSGQISNGVWTAELLANRPVYSKLFNAPENGRYTLLFPGAGESDQPGGDGYGTVKVDASGNITFGGALADGTKVAQSAFVSGAGQWPLYASLNSGKGLLFGWLTFTNLATNDIDGLVTWIKLPQSSAKYYKDGFTNAMELIASRYVFTNGVPVLNMSTGQVWLANGNLAESFTNQVILATNNKVTGIGTNKLSLNITTSSGLFNGSVTPPGGKVISIHGVVLQKQQYGGGFFLGTNQSGRVWMGP